MQKLTEKERIFATENHKLVLNFLKEKHLNDDFYDIVVFGYLKAVMSYVTNIELQKKYPFVVIAKRKMKDELVEYYINLDRQKRIADKTALRYYSWDEIEQPASMEKQIIDRYLYQKTFSILTKIEQQILILKLKQYRNKEIIDKCHITERIFYRHIHEMQNKLEREVYDMLLTA